MQLFSSSSTVVAVTTSKSLLKGLPLDCCIHLIRCDKRHINPAIKYTSYIILSTLICIVMRKWENVNCTLHCVWWVWMCVYCICGDEFVILMIMPNACCNCISALGSWISIDSRTRFNNDDKSIKRFELLWIHTDLTLDRILTHNAQFILSTTAVEVNVKDHSYSVNNDRLPSIDWPFLNQFAVCSSRLGT